jgi:glutamate synthase (NADPH/NADH) large chain
MTGGVLYLHLQPEMNLDRAAILHRIGRGADVELLPANAGDGAHLCELIQTYADELAHNHQIAEGDRVSTLIEHWERHFMIAHLRSNGR